MNFICSLIVVEDVKKSRELYETLLSQKVITDFGENVAFEGGFAIHQKAHFAALIDGKTIARKSNNFELYFEDDDLERIQERLKKNGFEFVHEIREQPWKQQVMRFYDYDAHIIEIGEKMGHVAFRLFKDGVAKEEIAKVTYLSQTMIDAAIEHYSNLE